MAGLEATTNEQIRVHVHDRIGAEINRISEGYITAHVKTGRALKAEFESYVATLGAIRFDNAVNFLTDLTAFLETLGAQAFMAEIHDRMSCLDFFRVIHGAVTYRPDRWKLALNDITARLDGLSKAPDVVETRRGRHLHDTHEVRERWTESRQRGFRSVTITKEKWSDCHVYAILTQEKRLICWPVTPQMMAAL